MAHTFTCLYFHVIFSTKLRRPMIPMDVRPKVWSYMGGIARENKARALAIGGMSDHAHLLLSLTPDMAVAKAVQVVKAGSSGWMSDLLQRDFKWQEGYAAFTVSQSNQTLHQPSGRGSSQDGFHYGMEAAAGETWDRLASAAFVISNVENSQSSGWKPDSGSSSHSTHHLASPVVGYWRTSRH